MRPGRPATITGAQREELWRRYKAGETVLGIGRALGQRPTTIHRVLQATGGIDDDVDLPECSALPSAEKSRAAFLPVTPFTLLPGTCSAPFPR